MILLKEDLDIDFIEEYYKMSILQITIVHDLLELEKGELQVHTNDYVSYQEVYDKVNAISCKDFDFS